MAIAKNVIPDCDALHATKWTIRLHVSARWSPVHPGRHVLYRDSAQDRNDDEVGTSLDPKELNPFHIDVRHLPPGGTLNYKYTKVRIVLKDPKAHFAKWDVEHAGKVLSIKGVGTDDPTNDKMLCGLTFKTDGGPHKNLEIAQFFIRINPASLRQPIDRPFTFAIYSDLAPQTPIVIDPSVRNYG
jgi:hypothetical protein